MRTKILLVTFLCLIFFSCKEGDVLEPAKGVDRQPEDGKPSAIAYVKGKVYDSFNPFVPRKGVRVNIRILDNEKTYSAVTDENGDYSVIIMVKYVDEEEMGSLCRIIMEYDTEADKGKMKMYRYRYIYGGITPPSSLFDSFKIYPGETVVKNIHFGSPDHLQLL